MTAVGAELADLRSELAAVQTPGAEAWEGVVADVRQAVADLAELRGQVAALEAPAAEAHDATATQLVGVTAELGELRTQVRALRAPAAHANELTTRVSQVTDGLADLRAQLDTVGEAAPQVAALTAEVGDLREQLAAAQSPGETARQAEGAEVSELVEELADLRLQLSDLRQQSEQPGDTTESGAETPPAAPAQMPTVGRVTPNSSAVQSRNPSDRIFRDFQSEPADTGSAREGRETRRALVPGFLSRLVRPDKKKVVEPAEETRQAEPSGAVERLRRMLREDRAEVSDTFSDDSRIDVKDEDAVR